MSPPGPRVLWPAPGFPAVLTSAEDSLELLVAPGDAGADGLRAWADGLALRAADGLRTPVPVRAIEPVTAPGEEPRIAAAVRALAPGRVVRLRCGVAGLPPPQPPARARVFAVVRGDACLRPRAVVRHVPGARLRIAFASDLHHAALWDEIHALLQRFAPALAAHALHPNTQVRRLVADVNARAARGELDALVLGGDLVDHVYRVPRAACAGRADETNLPGLEDALAPLAVPSFAIPGNHDHRLHPWRPRAYGLAAIGVPGARLRAVLRAAGHWDRWRLRWRDLDALRTHEPDGRDGLGHHLALLAPATDFAVSLGGLRLAFLSTGRDALCRWAHVEPGRGRLLVRSLRSSWEHPDSEGLRPDQIAGLARALGDARGGAAVFLHAPLLHPRPGEALEARLPRLEPGADAGPAADARFDRALFARGVRRGVFFRNAAPFLRALRAAPAPVAVFSGHVHRADAWRWDPRGGDTESCRSPRDVAAGGVRFTNAPAVAHPPADAPEEAPGYLVATFAEGRLGELERVLLPSGSNADAACQPLVS